MMTAIPMTFHRILSNTISIKSNPIFQRTKLTFVFLRFRHPSYHERPCAGQCLPAFAASRAIWSTKPSSPVRPRIGFSWISLSNSSTTSPDFFLVHLYSLFH